MSLRNQRGFTVAEVLVAVALLTVGVLAMVGSSALVTRMVGRGRESTIAGQVAVSRLERLRQIAASTPVRCSSPQWKSDSASDPASGVRERWDIEAGTGPVRRVRLSVSYATPRGPVADTLESAIVCG